MADIPGGILQTYGGSGAVLRTASWCAELCHGCRVRAQARAGAVQVYHCSVQFSGAYPSSHLPCVSSFVCSQLSFS